MVRQNQEVTRDEPKWCRESDDSIVVIKSRPVKAGNSVEDKTEMTCN